MGITLEHVGKVIYSFAPYNHQVHGEVGLVHLVGQEKSKQESKMAVNECKILEWGL